MTRPSRTTTRLAGAGALALGLSLVPGSAAAQAHGTGPGGSGGSAGPAGSILPPAEPSNEPKTKDELEAQRHFARARDLYQAGSYREAISELESARNLDPKAKDLVFNLGIVHERLSNFDEAIAAFQKYEQMDGVTAAEKVRAENSIKRIEGAKRTAAAARPKTPPGAGKVEPPATPTPAEQPRGRIDTATIAAASVAGAGLVAGAVFGIIAVSTKPSSSFVTGRDGSYQDLQDKTSAAHTDAIVSDIGFGVGIVAAAVTAYLFFGRTKEPTAAPSGARAAIAIVPSFSLPGRPGPGGYGGGAALGGSF